MGTFHKVGKAADLAPGKSVQVQVAGRTVALFNVDGRLHALDDACSHKGGPLCQGELKGDVVSCPWHGALFDVRDGSVKGGPTRTAQRSYAVRVEAGDVEVEVEV